MWQKRPTSAQRGLLILKKRPTEGQRGLLIWKKEIDLLIGKTAVRAQRALLMEKKRPEKKNRPTDRQDCRMRTFQKRPRTPVEESARSKRDLEHQ